MSNRKIITASATKGIGYFPATSAASDQYYDNVSLLLTGDVDVDDNFANVSLLLDGNTSTDKSNNKAAVTAYGNAAVTSVNKKFGTGSYYFDGTGDYLTIPKSDAFRFTSSNFTIEFWGYFNDISTGVIASLGQSGGSNSAFSVYYDTNQLSFYVGSNGASWDALVSSTFTLNTWTHFAIVRNGTSTTIYKNGLSSQSATSVNMFNDTVHDLVIGSQYTSAGILPNTGQDGNFYIDDLRITKGVARYTANFTPPVKALPTHDILDSSVYQLPVTTYGNARIDTTTKKFGNGSLYYPGATSYSYATTDNFRLNFGTGDFTVEGWYYKIGTTGNDYNTFFTIGDYTNGILLRDNTSGGNFYVNNTGYNVPNLRSSFSLNTWFHLALVRSNGTVDIYINGTNIYNTALSSSINPITRVCYIGAAAHNLGSEGWYGYIDDFRITKGLARYTSNFTPPTASLPTIPPTIPADPWWGNVSLLLDGNTTDAYDPYWQNVSLMLTGDDFIDWSNQHNAVTNNGSTPLSSSIKKYNSSSYDFSSTGRYLSMPTSSNFELLSNNFTIELWAYRTGNGTGDRFIIDKGNSQSFLLRWQAANSLQFYISSTNVLDYPNFAFTLATWYHIAVVRNGNLFTLYINGVSVTTGNSAASVLTTATNLAVCANSGSGGENFQGYLTDIRITKGIARYTANFTPPTAALPSYKIQDRTQNNLTLTPYGNVQLSTDVMKNGTGSMFFDGTGDYILFPSNDNFGFGTGDFTVEAWIFPPNYPTYAYICVVTNNPGGFVFYINAGSIKIRTWYTADLLSATAPSLNVWSHVAAVRSGTTLSIFVNGVSVASTTTNSTNFPINALRVGSDGTGGEWNGYIDDLRITKGIARYTQNFTPPSQSFATQYISTGYDANYADVSLLLNGNGTNGSTTFTDLSGTPKTITAYGDAKISTAVKKYGTGAIAFDGTGDVLKTPPVSAFTFGTGDFTVEGWFYQTADRIYPSALEINNHLGVGGILFITKYSDVACIYAADTGGGSFIAPQATTLNTWNHIAWVRNNGVLRTYVNGVSSSSAALTLNITATTSVTIGGEQSVTEGYCFPGYIDDFRITKGIARYTTNFTPPTYQLPTDTTGTVIDPLRASTSLLLRGNGTNGSTSFTDESPNGLTVTNNGSVTVNTTTKKYGTGSMAFSGTLGKYLQATIPAFGTGDFTIEMWVNRAGGANNGFLQFSSTSSLPGDTAPLAIGCLNNIWLIDCASAGQKQSSVAMTNSTWYHVALVRSASITKFYINGIVDTSTNFGGSAGLTDTTNYTATYVAIGVWYSAGYTWNGYIDDLRITKGYARYTSNFTPPTYEDPIVTGTVYDYNYPQVSLLLNGDGTNGSTVFTDLSSSPKAITNNGSVTVNTTTKKFGTGSMAFSGTNYLSLSTPAENIINWYSSDYTLEYWVNPTSFGSSSNSGSNVVGHAATADSGEYWSFGPLAGGTVKFYYYNGSPVGFASTTTIATGVWTHLAFVKYGTALTIYINGVSSATATMSGTPQSGNTLFFLIGKVTSATAFTGYIDDLRITKGLARYTQNFTPPTAPLPTSYS